MSGLFISNRFKLKEGTFPLHRAVLEYLFNPHCDADNAKIAKDSLPSDPYNNITEALAQVDLESCDSTLLIMLESLESQKKASSYHKIAHQILLPLLDEVSEKSLRVSAQFTCSASLRNAIYAGWLLRPEQPKSSQSITFNSDTIKATVATGTPVEKIKSFFEKQSLTAAQKAILYAACEPTNKSNFDYDCEFHFAADFFVVINAVYEYILNCLASFAATLSSAPQVCISFFSPSSTPQNNSHNPVPS